MSTTKKITAKITKKVTKKVATPKLDWSNEHISRYNAIYSRFIKTYPDANKETFMIDYANPRTGLYSWLEDDSGYARTTQKLHFLTIGRFLQMNNNSHYKTYLLKGNTLRNEIDKDEAENKQSDKEKEYFRSQNFLINIIDNMKEDYKLMQYKEHMRFLILCLSTLQAPLRSDFYVSSRIIHALKDNKGGEFNYVYINRKTKRCEYIVNDDKVSNSKYYRMHPELSRIPIEDDFLNELLLYSIESYPRTFLLQVSWREEYDVTINQNTYLNWLRKITQSPLINQDMLRSSYVTEFYKTHLRLADREILARKMRHSVETAIRHYNKIDDDEKPLTKDELTLDNEQLKNDLDLCNADTKNNMIKKLSDKLYTKRRYDVLYNLNTKEDITPRQSTLTKYQIYYDDETNLYV